MKDLNRTSKSNSNNNNLATFLFSSFLFLNTILHLSVITILIPGTRISYQFTDSGRSIGTDETVYGVMALKIAALEEFSTYCWKAQYASELVSYITAVIFHFLYLPVNLKGLGHLCYCPITLNCYLILKV